jgi:hypothetical protein
MESKMLNVPSRALLLAAACMAGAHLASAATEERLSKPDLLKLNDCMAMTSEVLAQDGQCAVVMKKASITKTDIEKMRRCEAKFNVEVSKDPDCAAMIKKHPDLVRGHGALMPEEPPPNEPKAK